MPAWLDRFLGRAGPPTPPVPPSESEGRAVSARAPDEDIFTYRKRLAETLQVTPDDADTIYALQLALQDAERKAAWAKLPLKLRQNRIELNPARKWALWVWHDGAVGFDLPTPQLMRPEQLASFSADLRQLADTLDALLEEPETP